MNLERHEINRYYRVTPNVVRAGQETEIHILPRVPHASFDPAAAYQVVHYPIECLDRDQWYWQGKIYPARLDGEALRAAVVFEGEQQHTLAVEQILPDRNLPVGDFAVYSVAADLFERFPYRGDFHMHSYRSDGIEAPAYVAAMCRKIGLDFMAVTDHHRYAPSLEAQQAFAGLPVDLAIFPGEEVHPPQNPIHIVNFGGRFSVNALFQEEAQYSQGVADLQAQLGAPPGGVDPYFYASAHWCFDQIRAAGGLGIFCHPYWQANRMMRIPETLVTALLATQPFDAYECVGGYPKREAESNVLQVARYYAETGRGKRIPIVGVSDAHGCHRELFGWYSTLVFSPSLALPDLIDSIKALYSVAVETVPGETPRVHGPYRLVKFAQFVLREIIPYHDGLCVEEGSLMSATLDQRSPEAQQQAVSRLSAVSGQCRCYLETCYAR